MTDQTAALLFLAAVLGGALNAVAGGGSFFSFPSLLAGGVPPVNANATSTVALWPGSVASVAAYRAELSRQHRLLVAWLALISLVGGVLGAVLLLRTPQTTFARLIPYLLLIATVLFALGGWPRPARALAARRSPVARVVLSLVQLGIAVYGGYFGGGIGILMLAGLGLWGIENVHEANAVKALLAACINGVAVLTFALAGAVFWSQAALMVVGATVGGYGAASYARRIDQRWVRRFVVAVGAVLTVYFFL